MESGRCSVQEAEGWTHGKWLLLLELQHSLGESKQLGVAASSPGVNIKQDRGKRFLKIFKVKLNTCLKNKTFWRCVK